MNVEQNAKPNVKQICLRLNLDKPLHKQTYDYLNGIDKSQLKSYTNAACLAITDYFQRYYKSADDPYFETREREERFIAQILAEVEKAIEKALPSFLTACLAGMVQPYAVKVPQSAENHTETAKNPTDEEILEEIDLDYIKNVGF